MATIKNDLFPKSPLNRIRIGQETEEDIGKLREKQETLIIQTSEKNTLPFIYLKQTVK